MKKDMIETILGVLCLLGIGTLNGIGYQAVLYINKEPLLEWWRIAVWGLVLGGLLSIMMIVYIYVIGKSEKNHVVEG